MICLVAGALAVALGPGPLTLAWTHSVEKVAWEEDWQEVPDGLKLAATRVRGSGAGMEPAPDARFVDGAWTWAPRIGVLPQVVLRRSGATADWRVCVGATGCREMGELVGRDADPVILEPCPER